MTWWAMAGAGIVVVGVVGAALSVVLRWSGAPGGRMGAAVLGGVMAGLLLGPGVGGRVAPDVFESAFVGGVQEGEALAALEREQGRAMAAAEMSGDGGAVGELAAAQALERMPLEEARREARARHARLVRGVVGSAAGLAMVLAGFSSGAIGRGMRRSRVSVSEGVGAGVMMVVVGMATGVVVGAFVMGLGVAGSLGLGLAMGVPAVGGGVRGRLGVMVMAGVLASAAGVAMLVVDRASAGMAAMGVGALAMCAAASSGVRVARGMRRAMVGVAAGALTPLVVGMATIECDPHVLWGSRVFWVSAILGVLLSSDGRWAGCAWACRLFPRGTGMGEGGARAWTGASGVVSAGTGPAQVMAGLVLVWGGVIGAEVLGGLVLGAVAIEVTRGLRRRVGWMLDGESV